MGSRMVIVVGDATSGGGQVITGSPETDIDGKPIARVNDKATCPKHKGVFPIVSSDMTFIVDGQPVARENDYLACGCTLMSTRQFRVFIDSQTSNNPAADRGMAKAAEQAVAAISTAADEYDEVFVLRSSFTNKPLTNRRYKIVREDGSHEEGSTDAEGRTHLAKSSIPEVFHLELGEEELPA